MGRSINSRHLIEFDILLKISVLVCDLPSSIPHPSHETSLTFSSTAHLRRLQLQRRRNRDRKDETDRGFHSVLGRDHQLLRLGTSITSAHDKLRSELNRPEKGINVLDDERYHPRRYSCNWLHES